MLLKSPPPAPPAFSWTGWYIGANGGAGWDTTNFDYNDVTAGAPFVWESAISGSGGLVGGQIGYNYQFQTFVLGLELDADWADVKGHGICNSTVFFINCNAKTSGLATLTGRIGVPIDKMLFYVKGGGAWGRDSYTISNVAKFGPTAFNSTISEDRYGWTIGMGLEYALWTKWSAKLEYDFIDFGTKRYNFAVVPGVFAPTFTNWDVTQVIHTMKAGVNYHF